MKNASSALCKCHSHLNHSVGAQEFRIQINEKSHRNKSCTGFMTFTSTRKIKTYDIPEFHQNDVIMTAMASQITSLTIVYPSFYSSTVQRKHQSSASLAIVRGIHRWPVFMHKGPVTRKLFPFDEVIMLVLIIQHDGLQCITLCVLCQHSEIFVIISLNQEWSISDGNDEI